MHATNAMWKRKSVMFQTRPHVPNSCIILSKLLTFNLAFNMPWKGACQSVPIFAVTNFFVKARMVGYDFINLSGPNFLLQILIYNKI